VTVPFDDDTPPDPEFPHEKKKREPGEWFALIGTGVLLGGALSVIGVLIVWLIVWLIHALPWS
jgi:hypothetical protein